MRPPEKRFFFHAMVPGRSMGSLAFGGGAASSFCLCVPFPLRHPLLPRHLLKRHLPHVRPLRSPLPPSVPLMHLKMSQDQLPLLRAPPLVSFAASPRCGRQWRLNLAPFCNQHAADLRRRWRRSWLNPLCTPVAAELRRRFLLWV